MHGYNMCFKQERKVSSRLPIQNKVSSRLPVADSKHKVNSGIPVAHSVAGCRFSCRFETKYIRSQVVSCRFSCRLPIQLPIRNRQYKFNESALATQLPVADSVADSKQTSSTNRQLAGCRFRFETDNISSTNRQPATQLLVADSVTDSKQTSSTNRQPATDSDSKQTI